MLAAIRLKFALVPALVCCVAAAGFWRLFWARLLFWYFGESYFWLKWGSFRLKLLVRLLLLKLLRLMLFPLTLFRLNVVGVIFRLNC